MGEDNYTTDMIVNLIQMLEENQAQNTLIEKTLTLMEDNYNGE